MAPSLRCLIGKQRQMPQRNDVHPFGAVALGQDGGLGNDARSCFLQDHAHPLQGRTGADDIIEDDRLFAF
jgi:hypothetical protein